MGGGGEGVCELLRLLTSRPRHTDRYRPDQAEKPSLSTSTIVATYPLCTRQHGESKKIDVTSSRRVCIVPPHHTVAVRQL